MDQVPLSSASVLQALLKTNRPPTDEERAVILESMAPANEEIRVVKEQISEAIAHIQALKSQLKQAEIELQCLHEKELAIWETTADQRRTLSCFRDFPEDVLREICLECIGPDIPLLTSPILPLQYTLMHVSSGIRRIVLETPSIWAAVYIQLDSDSGLDRLKLANLLGEVGKWFERAGGLALSIFVEDFAGEDESDAHAEFDPAHVLFDFLLTYSKRWKSVHFRYWGRPTLLTRIAALSTVDVPLLRTIELHLQCDTSAFRNSTILTIPTLENLTLETALHGGIINRFTVDWASLTSLTLNEYDQYEYLSAGELARILQQTKLLTFCDITVCEDLSTHADHFAKLDLPFLKTLDFGVAIKLSARASILELINAPILEILHIRGYFVVDCASKFLKRSPNIQELWLHQMFTEGSLQNITDLIRHSPSLTLLSLQFDRARWKGMEALDADRFLETFVQEDDSVTCSQLEYFTLAIPVNISFRTLCQFLKGKQRRITTPNSLRTWRGVTIDLSGILDADVRKKMSDLFAEKLEEGLNVRVYKVYKL